MVFLLIAARSKDKPRGEPPKFLVPLQPQKVKHGEKVVLETSVRGLPTPRVIWYHLDKEVVPSPEFVQEHDTTTGRVVLTINEVFIDDKGLYRCLAVNEFGRDETASYVTVEDIEVLEKCELRQAPRITLPLQPQILKKHSSLDLLARYEAFPQFAPSLLSLFLSVLLLSLSLFLLLHLLIFLSYLYLHLSLNHACLGPVGKGASAHCLALVSRLSECTRVPRSKSHARWLYGCTHVSGKRVAVETLSTPVTHAFVGCWYCGPRVFIWFLYVFSERYSVECSISKL